MNLKTIILAAVVALGPAVPMTLAAESGRDNGMNECRKRRVYRSYNYYPRYRTYYHSGYYPRYYGYYPGYYGYRPGYYGYPYHSGLTVQVGPLVYRRY